MMCLFSFKNKDKKMLIADFLLATTHSWKMKLVKANSLFWK